MGSRLWQSVPEVRPVYVNRILTMARGERTPRPVDLPPSRAEKVKLVRSSDKILSLQELAATLAPLKAAGKRVVQTHGCFDLLHIGHIRYLERAKRLGDILVVTVTPDCYVNKGPHRPAFPDLLRAEAIAALDAVDYVAINEWPTAVETLDLLRPDVYAKGAEFRQNRTPEIVREEAAVAAIGAEIAFVEDLTSSSSELINRHLLPFPAEVGQYLTELAERRGADAILRWLEQAQALRVLVVGEAIIDEYHYCQALQRSAHGPALALQHLSTERFVGGAAAVANNLAAFCSEVHLIALVGEQQSEEEWLRSQLRENVRVSLQTKAGSPTIVRGQYREAYFAQSLFELYRINDEPLSAADDTALCALLGEHVGGYDVVVAADYGHGMFTAGAIDVLCQGARHLTVNTQIDAANVGYHSVGRYPRADYLCLAEQELRLECRTRSEAVEEMLAQVAGKLCASEAVVMRGGHGCFGYMPQEAGQQAPALASRVVDRLGAADAFLAVTALCAAQHAPLDVLCFLGNVAGAEAVAMVGNREPLSKLAMRRHVESLLK
jgi:rfaE bifunctional protein kinase chain/domain/rfaE bifunctional protein nucleotidyltransferase chain/domain